MKHTPIKSLLLMASALTAAGADGNPDVPVITPFPSGITIYQLSDNGRWGLSEDTSETDEGQTFTAGGAVWDIASMTSTAVAPPASGRASLNDITDDGTVIVGSANGIPALYSAASRTWTALPLPEGYIAGAVSAVTPDGKWAVGYAHRETEWDASPLLYDLQTQSLVELPAVPSVDMNHEVSEINRFCAISPDGRYVLGRMSEQMLMPVAMCAYVYDRQDNTVSYIGFTPNASRPWTPQVKNLYFINACTMSANGSHITGSSYMVHESADPDGYPDEYYTAYLHDVASGRLEVYDGPYDADYAGFAVSDDGTVLAATPADNPYATMAVRVNGYYYPLEEICRQAYGLDLSARGISNTGKPLAVSADGLTVASVTGPAEGFIIRMPEPWSVAAGRVNLLSSRRISPADGSVMSQLSKLTLTFSRAIDVSGAANRIKLLDSEGNTVASALAADVSDATLSVRFRTITLESGKTYTVEIPDGFVTMSGDANVSSGPISVSYVGRHSGPVLPLGVEPADGASFSRLDPSTNRIHISFDAPLKVADGARASLRRKGESVVLADLNVSLADANIISLYPSARQYLYDGTDYEVTLPAGSVTDLSGNGANEEMTLSYSGNYIREVSPDDKYIFLDDCNDYASFMYFDGDRLAPGAIPRSWGFQAEVPWYLVRESEESTDMALAAHSMFADGGRADDWAVTPQLFIPDGNCRLRFEAQSYLKSKADRLKVYAFEDEQGYSTLTAAIVNRIRSEGDLIFNERLLPGDGEETLAGEWVTYTVDLAGYAGKNIYLAFVNDNEDQSAVFVNHVEVIRDIRFLASLTVPTTVVALDSAPVEGVITVVSDALTVSSIALDLLDASGRVVDTCAESGLNLTAGKGFTFAFAKPLPLNRGVANRFGIKVTINGEEASTLTYSIKNLEFATTRRVVVEEFSGATCSNCPLGFLAMENLERLYPGRIIPVVIRTYEDDPLGYGLGSYTKFLGLNNIGAPSAAIDRAVACYPMMSEGNDYFFSGAAHNQTLWLDATETQMRNAAEADIDFTATYDAGTGRIGIDGTTSFALNSSRNVNLFTVLLEDKLPTEQSNGLRYFSDPDLGEWGKGGLYGSRVVSLEIDHVARATYGTTFNGTAGLVPPVQTAATANSFSYSVDMPGAVADARNTRLVIMMIDSDTDMLINANAVPVSVVNSAIDEVEAGETAQAEYFDLQGRRVAAPERGRLLIRREGSKITKIIF